MFSCVIQITFSQNGQYDLLNIITVLLSINFWTTALKSVKGAILGSWSLILLAARLSRLRD